MAQQGTLDNSVTVSELLADLTVARDATATGLAEAVARAKQFGLPLLNELDRSLDNKGKCTVAALT